jgi:hypothetical protein
MVDRPIDPRIARSYCRGRNGRETEPCGVAHAGHGDGQCLRRVADQVLDALPRGRLHDSGRAADFYPAYLLAVDATGSAEKCQQFTFRESGRQWFEVGNAIELHDSCVLL